MREIERTGKTDIANRSKEIDEALPCIDLGVAHEILREVAVTDHRSDKAVVDLMARRTNRDILAALAVATVDVSMRKPYDCGFPGSKKIVGKKPEKAWQTAEQQAKVLILNDGRKELSLITHVGERSISNSISYTDQDKHNSAEFKNHDPRAAKIPEAKVTVQKDGSYLVEEATWDPHTSNYTIGVHLDGRGVLRHTEAPIWSREIPPVDPTERDYKTLLFGLRWHAKTLLDWDQPGLILPEDLLDLSPSRLSKGTIFAIEPKR